MNPTPLRVLIVGGGIGGLCLAQGLKRAGVGVAVYERDHSRAERLEGFRIHINPDGSGALHESLPPPLWEAFVSTAGEPGDLGFLTEYLEELAVVEEGDAHAGKGDPAGRSHAADRVTLRRLLLAGLDDEVHFDKKFERYERSPGGKVTAFFADGTSATGDVLVGADGANSRVREQYLPWAERAETGAVGVGLKLPLTEQTRSWLPPRISTGMNMVIVPAPYFLFTSAFERRSGPADALRGPGVPVTVPGGPDLGYRDYVLCAFVARRDALPPDVWNLDGPGLQGAVGAMIEDWHPDLRRLVAESDPDSAWLGSFAASVPVAPWETTNVTLLGDAIHSMPPVGGLGGNTALRDAALLGRTLGAVHREEALLLPALQGYEAEMLDYGFAAFARRSGTSGKVCSNRLVVAGARAWFRVLNAVSALGRKHQPNAEHARKRSWERGRLTDRSGRR